MNVDPRAMVRRIGPWLTLGAVVVVLAAVIPVARSLWTTTLGVAGEVATGEFGPDVVLEIGDVTVVCEGEPSAVAVVVNRGEAETDGRASVELWFGAAEGTGYETLVGTQALGPLQGGASVEVAEGLGAGDGRYAFRLAPPGASSAGAIWSGEIGFTAAQCAAPEPALSEPPTTLPPETTPVPPETTTTVAPETTTTSPPETTTTTAVVTTTTAAPGTTTTTAAPETTTTTAAPETTTTTTAP